MTQLSNRYSFGDEMPVLIHNTCLKNAQSILRQRRIYANVESGRRYNVNSGPFFFVENQARTEVPSGGHCHEVDLYFDCMLPVIGPLSRLEINAAIANGRHHVFLGHVVLGTGMQKNKIDQAIIVPNVTDCLRLIRIDASINSSSEAFLLELAKKCRKLDVLLPPG
ncbi:hypothetical protein [Methylobacterium radiotolerans]|uniref:hypothetical protein n=1 Tax=Methylobacterium radiotolerans TaxID=31998 RepID=UPI0015F4F8A5|nr:hypothetical protein [Methylobacterium radiotolerans]